MQHLTGISDEHQARSETSARPLHSRCAAYVLAATVLWLATAAGSHAGVTCDSVLAPQIPEAALEWDARARDNLVTFDAAWQIIYDTYFDPDFPGIDWEGIRTELRPKAAAAESPEALRQVITDMLGRLGQSHFALIPGASAAALAPGRAETRGDDRTVAAGDATPATTGVPGLQIRLLDGRLVVTRVDPDGPAFEAGVQIGWVLVRIGERRLDEWLTSLAAGVDPRHAQVNAVVMAAQRLVGPVGSTLHLEFLDGRDEVVPIEIRRAETRSLPVKLGDYPTFFARLESQRLVSDDGRTSIGVIHFNTWMPPVARLFDMAIDRLRQADGIVLDLRGNPGGLAHMVTGLSGHFLNEPAVLGTMETRDAELRFPANPRRVSVDGQQVQPFDRPVAIVIDGLTASASEIFAGGFQAIGRARVFGETSMGAVLGSVTDRLPNGDVLQHALGDFVTADGQRLEGRGVVPDEAVPLSREDLLAGRDAPIVAAVRWLLGQRSTSERPPRVRIDETVVRTVPAEDGSRVASAGSPDTSVVGLTPLVGLPLPTDLGEPAADAPDPLPAETAPLPGARDVIARYVEALGGQDALLRHSSRRLRGTLAVPAQGMHGEVEMLTARPDKMLVRTTMSGLGPVANGFDGTTAWWLNPMTGPMLLTGTQLEQTRADAFFDAALHPEDQYRRQETVGITRFEGKQCYELRLVRTTNHEEFEYYDVETGLLVASVVSRETPMGTVKATSVFDDYIEFGGVLLATRTTQRLLGTEQIITITSVEFDTVDSSVFKVPAEIAALVKASTDGDR